MRPVALTERNQQRKETLTRKIKKTKEEQAELNRYQALIGEKQSDYDRHLRIALNERTPEQKKYNKYYTEKIPVYYPVIKYPVYEGDSRRKAKLSKTDQRNMLQFAEDRISYRRTGDIDKRTGAVATPETPPQFVETLTLPIESVRDGKLRVFAYLYDRMKRENTENDDYFFNVKYATMDQLVEMELNFKPFAIKYKDSEDTFERIAEEFFGLSIEELNKGITKAERANWAVRGPSNPDELVFANEWGSSLGRYFSNLEKVRSIDYEYDRDTYWCTSNISSTMGERPIAKSLTSSVDYHLCVGVFRDIEQFNDFFKNEIKGLSHQIILHPEYLPIGREQAMVAQNPTLQKVGKLFDISYVEDAFKEQAVDAMDEDLFQLLLKNSPKLLEASKVILATPKFLKELTVSKLFSEHYIILSEEAFPEELAIAYKNPLLIIDVITSMKKPRNFILCDPYTAYCTKKKDPGIWSNMFGMKIKNKEEPYNIGFSVYNLLSDTQKFFVDFYQFAQILENTGLTNNSSISNQRLMEASDVYNQPISSSAFLDFIMDNSDEDDLYFKQFLKLQKNIITYDKPILSKDDVYRFLNKFRSIPITIPSINRPVREENIEHLSRYENLKREIETRGNRNAPRFVRPENRRRESERPVLSIRVPVQPRNELTQLRSRIQQLKNERSTLLRNPMLYNASSTTRKNKAVVNKQYANQLKRLGFFSRFTKGQQRKQLEVNRAAARKAFESLNALNRNIQQLEEQLARRYPRLPESPVPRNNIEFPLPARTPPSLPASPGSSAGTAGSSNSSASRPPFPPGLGGV